LTLFKARNAVIPAQNKGESLFPQLSIDLLSVTDCMYVNIPLKGKVFRDPNCEDRVCHSILGQKTINIKPLVLLARFAKLAFAN